MLASTGSWAGALDAGQAGRTLKTGEAAEDVLQMSKGHPTVFLGSCSHRPRAGHVNSQCSCRLSCCLGTNLGFSAALQCIATKPKDPGTGKESMLHPEPFRGPGQS
jgi:hypothetical protein